MWDIYNAGTTFGRSNFTLPKKRKKQDLTMHACSPVYGCRPPAIARLVGRHQVCIGIDSHSAFFVSLSHTLSKAKLRIRFMERSKYAIIHITRPRHRAQFDEPLSRAVIKKLQKQLQKFYKAVSAMNIKSVHRYDTLCTRHHSFY